MKCEDKVDCDEFNTQNVDLPSMIVSTIERYTTHAEKRIEEYKNRLKRRHQETLLWKLIKILVRITSYTPVALFLRFGFFTTKTLTHFTIHLMTEALPLIEAISDKKVMKVAEESLGNLVKRLLPDDKYTVVKVICFAGFCG